MKIELTELEYLEMFGDNKGKKIHERDFVINGETYVAYDWKSSFWNHFPPDMRIVEMTLFRKPYKSPQEIAAEEAVEKAESALKAAKDVIKTVKEK